MLFRRSGESILARAAPPALPPLARLGALLGLSSASPVAMRPTRMAAPITSAGRFSPLGPLGMQSPLSKVESIIDRQLMRQRRAPALFKLRHYRVLKFIYRRLSYRG